MGVVKGLVMGVARLDGWQAGRQLVVGVVK